MKTEANDRGADVQGMRGLSSRQIWCVTFVVVATVFTVWVALKFGLNAPPSASGDEPSYDSIAWELSKGQGFAVDYSDADFRLPYDRAASANARTDTLPAMPSGPIAFRPPLFPLLVSGTNIVFGRQFWAIRMFNIICMAATAALLANFLHREFGLAATVTGVLLFLADTRTRLYARAILTESLACLLATLLTLALFHFGRTRDRRYFLGAAVLTGLSILTRSIVVLWLPGLVLMIWRLVQEPTIARRLKAYRHVTTFAYIVCAMLLPWSLRNTQLLREFKPMGTQGMMEISAGYSDATYDHFGVWQNLDSAGVFKDVVNATMTNAERELAIARHSTDLARTWIDNNSQKLPALAAMKVYSEFRPRGVMETTVLLFAVIGAVVTFRTLAGRLMLGLLATNAFAIAVTWSVEGRFLVPQLFILHALSAVGFVRILNHFRPSQTGGKFYRKFR